MHSGVAHRPCHHAQPPTTTAANVAGPDMCWIRFALAENHAWPFSHADANTTNTA